MDACSGFLTCAILKKMKKFLLKKVSMMKSRSHSTLQSVWVCHTHVLFHGTTRNMLAVQECKVPMNWPDVWRIGMTGSNDGGLVWERPRERVHCGASTMVSLYGSCFLFYNYGELINGEQLCQKPSEEGPNRPTHALVSIIAVFWFIFRVNTVFNHWIMTSILTTILPYSFWWNVLRCLLLIVEVA